VPDPPHQGHLVRLEAHPGAASEAQPPASQPALDVLCGHQQAGGQPLDDHHKGASVRLTGSQEAEHAGKSTRGGSGQDPAWNRLWAMGPPQKTAITAPVARDGAKGIRVLRPDAEITIISTPNSIPTMKPDRKAT
jgi:hypothetical protein